MEKQDPVLVTEDRERSPTRAEVGKRLAALLEEICGLPRDRIKENSTIDRDLEMESVQMVELQVALEQEFNITIDFLEVLRRNSFRSICAYLHLLAMSPERYQA
jgi:acyl carrier protein